MALPFRGRSRQCPAAVGQRSRQVEPGIDVLVVNAVGENCGFGNVPNRVTLLDRAGQTLAKASGTKREVAQEIIDYLAKYLTSPQDS